MQRKRWIKKGKPLPPWVFASLEGTALDERNVRHVFTRILQKADLRQIRIHDLRHTFASLLLQQGESIVYVKEQLGHASIQITVDTYGHLIPGANRAAVDKLDDVTAQPDATPAQPEAVSTDQRERRKLFGMSGDPNIRQLEPDWRMAQTPRRAPMGGLSARPLFFPVPEFRKAAACITTIHVAEQRCDWTFLVHS